jgi:hypothetical protein
VPHEVAQELIDRHDRETPTVQALPRHAAGAPNHSTTSRQVDRINISPSVSHQGHAALLKEQSPESYLPPLRQPHRHAEVIRLVRSTRPSIGRLPCEPGRDWSESCRSSPDQIGGFW